MLIRQLADADFEDVFRVVNDAAVAYRTKIPADCYKVPYMPRQELQEEIESGVVFYGYIQDGAVVAVMGIQLVAEVTLIRHAYTLTSFQRMGIGKKLLRALLELAETDQILVGTWQNADWAIRFYQKHGFTLLSRQETNRLLGKYWNIPQRQIETSVVLSQRRTK